MTPHRPPTRLLERLGRPRPSCRRRSAGVRWARRRTRSSRSPRCAADARAGGSGSPTLAAEHPTATESELGWLAVEELSVAAAALLEPAFRASGGARRPALDPDGPAGCGVTPSGSSRRPSHFDALAPNVIVKIPATSAGDRRDRGGHGARDQHQRHRLLHRRPGARRGRGGRARAAPARGGRPRRQQHGPGVHDHGGPPGRLDEGGRRQGRRHARPGVLRVGRGGRLQAGVPSSYTERGYRTRLLSAAFRNHMHWSQLVGGRRRHLAAVRLAASGSTPAASTRCPGSTSRRAATCSTRCTGQVREFRRAYDPDGLDRRRVRHASAPPGAPCGSSSLPPRTSTRLVRDVLLPDPDKERTAP